LLIYGLSSLAIRFLWIQAFRFSVIHRIENTPGGWDWVYVNTLVNLPQRGWPSRIR
jgi:hypothetical protein